jgi:hypothetical protein
MRISATSVEFSGLRLMSANDGTSPAVTGIILNTNLAGNTHAGLDITSASGLTTNAYYQLSANGTIGSYVAVSAEL